MKNLKLRVKLNLTIHKETRDNDQLLISNIWANEIGIDIFRMDGEALLTLIGTGTLESPESIVRHRRKLQEQNEHLRGVTYNERQRKSEEVRKTINN